MLPTARKLAFSEVPVIDMAPAWSGVPAKRKAVTDAIAEASGQVGFFYMRNHGIPQEVFNNIFQTAQDFYALPAEAKMEVSVTKNNHFQGYVHTMNKGNDPNITESLQEAFQIRRPLEPDDPDLLAGKPYHGVIPWPSAMPNLQPRMMAYFDKLSELGYKMLDIFEESLEMPNGSLKPIVLSANAAGLAGRTSRRTRAYRHRRLHPSSSRYERWFGSTKSGR
jgi:isopenicillin N synthase-like dioxygenase